MIILSLIVLEGFLPDLDGLPLYLLRLASEVDWSNEKECFFGFCRETARFYVLHPWKQQCSDVDDISVSHYIIRVLNKKTNFKMFKNIFKGCYT